MTTSKNIALYQLGLKEVKTYLLAAAFVIGNIALPQLCHLIPQGGLIFLPIYFFTLIAAYKYGFTVGLLTAIFLAAGEQSALWNASHGHASHHLGEEYAPGAGCCLYRQKNTES